MSAKSRTIEIDSDTADVLASRAAARGLSVRELVAELAAQDESEADQVAELERRWRRVEAGERTISHGDVVKWLESWGAPTFSPRKGS
jgi:predicted transcriptional regulator